MICRVSLRGNQLHRFPLRLSFLGLLSPPGKEVGRLVRTPEHVRQRLELGDFFIREIVEKGRVLYDAADGRVGAEG
jgi:hypothetical protein